MLRFENTKVAISWIMENSVFQFSAFEFRWMKILKLKIDSTDQSTEIKKAIGITLMDLIPHKSRQRKTLILADYYYYKGSLTTPPCCENVSWFILKPRVPITDYEVFMKSRGGP